MLIHAQARLVLFFGDRRASFIPRNYYAQTAQTLINQQPFSMIKKRGADSLFFLHQTHSNQGFYVSSKNVVTLSKPFGIEGDFLITSCPTVALGVATADCLPIVMHDKKNNAVAVVHAGWRGSAQSIALKTLERMRQTCGSQPEHLSIFFGPSAKKCCYHVGDELIEAITAFSYYEKVLTRTGQQTTFDLPLLNQLQLASAGIQKAQIHTAYNSCTIHTENLNSYRRNQTAERQATIAFLTE